MSNSATQLPAVRQHCSAMPSAAALDPALEKHILATPPPLPAWLLTPSDLFNDDDKEVRVTIRPTGSTAPTTAIFAVAYPVETPSRLTHYFGDAPPQPWQYHSRTGNDTMEAAVSLSPGQDTTVVVPLEAGGYRLGDSGAQSLITTFSLGEVRSSHFTAATTGGRVRFVPRPNLLRIISGNPQVAAVGTVVTTPLVVGVFHMSGTTLQLDEDHLVRIPDQTVRFTALDPTVVTLVKGATGGSPGTDCPSNIVRTNGRGLASSLARPLTMLDQREYGTSWYEYFFADTSYNGIVTHVRNSAIQVEIVDDGEALPVKGFNERPTSDYQDAAKAAKAASWLRLDAGNWQAMPQNSIVFNLAGVEPRAPAPITVHFYVTDDARKWIREMNSIQTVDLSIKNAVVTTGGAGPLLNSQAVIDIATQTATGAFASYNMRFRSTTQHPSLGATSPDLVVVLMATSLSSLDRDTYSDVNSINVLGRGWMDFAHDEVEAVSRFDRGTSLAHSSRLFIEAFATLRSPSGAAGTGPAFAAEELGKLVGRVLAHEVGHNLGLVSAQIFGHGWDQPNSSQNSTDGGDRHATLRTDGVVSPANFEDDPMVSGIWRSNKDAANRFQGIHDRYLKLVVPGN